MKNNGVHYYACLLTALSLSCASGCAMFSSNDSIVIANGLSADPEKAAKLNEQGIVLFERCDHEAAIQTFQEATTADPSFGPAHNNLGLAYFEAGNLYAAAGSFQTASQLMPNRADPLGNLGLTLEAAQKFDEAMSMYEAAYGIDQTNPEILGNLIRARMRRGDSDESVRMQLKELLFIETRPEWIEWIQDQLAVFLNPRIQNQTVSPDFNPNLSAGTVRIHDGVPGFEVPMNIMGGPEFDSQGIYPPLQPAPGF